MTKNGLQNIFSVPFYSTILEPSVVEYMEQLIVPRLPQLNCTKGENVYSDFNNSKKLVNVKELSLFIKTVNPIIKKFSKFTSIELNTKIEYWIQNYHPHQNHDIHAHPGAYISGVYYIRANKEAGNIEFFNPNPHPYFQKYINTPKQTFQIKPKKGMLILFPSYLFHRVLGSSSSDVVRTCLAFNL